MKQRQDWASSQYPQDKFNKEQLDKLMIYTPHLNSNNVAMKKRPHDKHNEDNYESSENQAYPKKKKIENKTLQAPLQAPSEYFPLPNPIPNSQLINQQVTISSIYPQQNLLNTNLTYTSINPYLINSISNPELNVKIELKNNIRFPHVNTPILPVK